MSELLEFHEWKERVRKREVPLVRDPQWYFSAYGRYCKKARKMAETTKQGSTPANCIMGSPYCDCSSGSRCKLLPSDLASEND